VADDFRPLGAVIDRVCVWGYYIETDPTTTTVDCGDEVATDYFRVRVYADKDGLPDSDNIIGERTALAQRGKIPDAPTLASPFDLPVETYGHQLTLDTPITGLDSTGETCYWLEVVNNTSDDPDCNWYWLQTSVSSTQGNGYAAAGGEVFGYDPGAERAWDHSFCISADMIQGCELPQRACCSCGGTCTLETFADCDNHNGNWHIDVPDCAGFTCVVGAPANDTCTDVLATQITDGSYQFVTFCATTDGDNPVPTDFAEDPIEQDLWYRYIATRACKLRADMCSTATAFDGMVAIYNDPDNPTECVCPYSDELTERTLRQARDENCSGNGIGGSAFAETDAVQGGCYLIRVGGWPGTDQAGTGAVDISCAGSGEAVLDMIAEPNGVAKNRYISVVAPDNGGAETAIRVTLVDLQTPNPPNLPQFLPPPFGAFEAGSCTALGEANGCVRYVGEPTFCTETDVPATAFRCATLQCAAHFMDWSDALGSDVLHVTGAEIVPSSAYDVHQLGASCQGNEAGCSVVSDTALRVTTVRWGDVVAPFQDPTPASLSQPNISDVAAVVDKFKGVLTAPIKSRAQLQPNIPNPAGPINILDVANTVDAFKSFAYPYTGPVACP
jgi:hypothetical protein